MENHIPYSQKVQNAQTVLANSKAFYTRLNQRRSVRFFTNKAVEKETIENILATAGTAPSGANKQPWHFVAISHADIKSKIRAAAEEEEKAFYNGRATAEWLEDLKPIGTDWRKPFLEIAPWIIVVFKKTYNDGPNGKSKNYYVQESVGIACGFLIAAIHEAGLGTLTHTPSPMNFLSEILNRPASEKPYLLLPIGYVATDATVPNITRKSLDELATFLT